MGLSGFRGSGSRFRVRVWGCLGGAEGDGRTQVFQTTKKTCWAGGGGFRV